MECPVCFEEFGFLAGNTPMALPCQHTFCKQCVESLKLQNQMKTCPLCRTRFAPVQTVVNLGLRSALEEFKRICPPFLRSALEEFKRTCPRSRSRTPPQITARGSIGRVIHQPRTPPELIARGSIGRVIRHQPRTPPELIPAVSTTAEDTPVSDSIPGYQGPSSHLTPEQLEVLEDVPPELIQARASQDSRRLLNESNLTHRIERTLKGYAN